MTEIIKTRELQVEKIAGLLKKEASICLDQSAWQACTSLHSEISELKNHVWLCSSGSYEKKLLALSHSALRASAQSVNDWFQVNAYDCWALALPLNHIAGFSIISRSLLAEFKIAHYQQSWEAFKFSNFIAQEKCSLASLVPTQIFDLVSRELEPPPFLRAVLVGGARLSRQIYNKARNLGWPLFPSYGLTECCSMVASASVNSLNNSDSEPELLVLPHLKCQLDLDRRLIIKGSSVYSALIQLQDQTSLKLEQVDSSNGYVTQDLAHLSTVGDNTKLEVIGRADRQIKVNGWLVSLDEIETLIRSYFELKALQPIFAVVAKEDMRQGFRLVLNISAGGPTRNSLTEINQYLENKDAHYPAISEIIEHNIFPLLANGKIDYRALIN